MRIRVTCNAGGRSGCSTRDGRPRRRSAAPSPVLSGVARFLRTRAARDHCASPQIQFVWGTRSISRPPVRGTGSEFCSFECGLHGPLNRVCEHQGSARMRDVNRLTRHANEFRASETQVNKRGSCAVTQDDCARHVILHFGFIQCDQEAARRERALESRHDHLDRPDARVGVMESVGIPFN